MSDDGVVNTYKELIDYAASSGSDITTLIGNVSALTSKLTLGKVSDEEGAAEYATVKAYVEAYVSSQISAAELSQGNGITISDGTVAAKVKNENGLSVNEADGIQMATVVASSDGVGGSNGAMTAVDKEKLDNITMATADDIAAAIAELSFS